MASRHRGASERRTTEKRSVEEKEEGLFHTVQGLGYRVQGLGLDCGHTLDVGASCSRCVV